MGKLEALPTFRRAARIVPFCRLTVLAGAPKMRGSYSKPDELAERGVSVVAEGYCVKCKAKKEIAKAEEITMKNGRKALQGVCSACGTKITRIEGPAALCGTRFPLDGGLDKPRRPGIMPSA